MYTIGFSCKPYLIFFSRNMCASENASGGLSEVYSMLASELAYEDLGIYNSGSAFQVYPHWISSSVRSRLERSRESSPKREAILPRIHSDRRQREMLVKERRRR